MLKEQMLLTKSDGSEIHFSFYIKEVNNESLISGIDICDDDGEETKFVFSSVDDLCVMSNHLKSLVKQYVNQYESQYLQSLSYDEQLDN